MNGTECEQLQGRILTAMEELQAALADHKAAALKHAEADHAYRQAQAREYLLASVLKRDDGKYYTEDHRRAVVDAACDRQMHACRLAEAEHEAAKERVRALQTQISAGQSLLGAERAEANAIRYGMTAGA